jgi:hypothetical protein
MLPHEVFTNYDLSAKYPHILSLSPSLSIGDDACWKKDRQSDHLRHFKRSALARIQDIWWEKTEIFRDIQTGEIADEQDWLCKGLNEESAVALSSGQSEF